MACKAKIIGEVKRRGQSSVEWYDKNGKPQRYCCGYNDASTEALIDVCKECRNNVIYAQEDLEKEVNKERDDG